MGIMSERTGRLVGLEGAAYLDKLEAESSDFRTCGSRFG